MFVRQTNMSSVLSEKFAPSLANLKEKLVCYIREISTNKDLHMLMTHFMAGCLWNGPGTAPVTILEVGHS